MSAAVMFRRVAKGVIQVSRGCAKGAVVAAPRRTILQQGQQQRVVLAINQRHLNTSTKLYSSGDGSGAETYTDTHMTEVLQKCRTIAMVGASPNFRRPSYVVVLAFPQKTALCHLPNPPHLLSLLLFLPFRKSEEPRHGSIELPPYAHLRLHDQSEAPVSFVYTRSRSWIDR